MKLPPFGTRLSFSYAAAVSRTLRVRTPSMLIRVIYSLCARGRGTRPRVAFSPTKPQKLAGMRVEPPPSEDRLIGVIPESTVVLDASNQGVPAVHLKDTDVAQAYRDVVARFLGEERPMRFVDAEKRGFLKRLLAVAGR